MKIVIVGGGAGGLELATKMGRKLGKKQKADVVLIDRNSIHIWKPLLHEVASGSLDSDLDAVNYRLHAHKNGFTFKLGALTDIDCAQKIIHIDALLDEAGAEVLPKRQESYDVLVLAIGSVSNDFNVEGVAEHCIFLDSPDQARRFHQKLLNQFIALNRRLGDDAQAEPLRIAIVGGGATGVELSAELYKAREWFSEYGLSNINSEHLQVTLLEAGKRLLPALNERISHGAHAELTKIGVNVRTQTAVVKATDNALITGEGEEIRADIMVWAAGVKAPNFLREIEGLSCNRANQIIVEPTLQAKGQADIFVLGDCAGCQMGGDEDNPKWVPPRAQSAHQMASQVAKNLLNRFENKPLEDFTYNDFGSLVSLSDYTAFGRLMGGLAKGGLSLEGRFARWAYVSLYRMHQIAIYGLWRTVVVALGDRINHFLRPKFKLH